MNMVVSQRTETAKHLCIGGVAKATTSIMTKAYETISGALQEYSENKSSEDIQYALRYLFVIVYHQCPF